MHQRLAVPFPLFLPLKVEVFMNRGKIAGGTIDIEYGRPPPLLHIFSHNARRIPADQMNVPAHNRAVHGVLGNQSQG